MGLYTIIVDYKGGTYLAQVEASSASAAVSSWVEQMNPADIAGLTPARKEELKLVLEENKVAAVDSCTNVWCTSGNAGGDLALVHIVQTSKGASKD